MNYDQAFKRIASSKFRSSFHLSNKDKEYVRKKGMDVIERHARDFVKERFAPKNIVNDGKQTPWKGHPVFIAQHACACCCRGCLHKWYRVQLGVELTALQQEKIVRLLMEWINGEMKKDVNAQ
ncbi:MAG: DUF4186 domain-containing protein [Bacillota bacterium]|nr:DUF4186 domain-containing protein [Bacillota bacterium]